MCRRVRSTNRSKASRCSGRDRFARVARHDIVATAGGAVRVARNASPNDQVLRAAGCPALFVERQRHADRQAAVRIRETLVRHEIAHRVDRRPAYVSCRILDRFRRLHDMRMRSDHQIGAPAVESRRQLALTGAGQSLVLVSPMNEQRDMSGSVLPGQGDLAANSHRVDAVHATPGTERASRSFRRYN